MLVSQLHDHPSEPAQAAATTPAQTEKRAGFQAQVRSGANISQHPSDHTKIWSDLSGSANRNGNGTERRQFQEERNLDASGQREITRLSAMHISKAAPDRENEPIISDTFHMEKGLAEEPQDRSEINVQDISQRHRSNWVDANEDDEDDDGDKNGLYVQSTPPYNEEH
ncbi:uncharacterized protein LOC21384716 [Morus notabilis]|uniref:uncharacterized protein LOC21384716 n=1 Tax=Morus notabilis TaxID=981085 RepID=UPI000CED02D4|nr:uncharacterized protein LOC21384716 [Morus notabilis]